ncbi:AAA family ATPase [Streptomyces sp. G-5]|uniref:AAA family ATPase n=1 Tax=Streptomyces sp. G-5 TaxID=2977231 RepID=UPI0021D320A3|nr:AAA family ATPase [Streptomyces sp. G-5]MCU4747696.1 AAA family ATPase [Streptomyces sp. G-5]
MIQGGEFQDGFTDRLARFDRAAARKTADRAEEEGKGVLDAFPLEDWSGLSLERYALGPSTRSAARPSFCRLLEYGTNAFGSIRGGSAAKHIVYQHRSGEWRIVPSTLRRLDVHEAWERVREDFLAAFSAAGEGAYERLDELELLSYGQALATKTLAIYFPEAFLPVFSASHIRHFTALLGGRPHSYSSGVRAWRANRELLNLVRRTPQFEGWRPHEVTEFLYAFHDPRPKDRAIWKVAPGERASLWEDCLTHGWIRIGWDEVGSLAQFESDQELKDALDQYWPGSTGGNLRLARQMLAFRDLERGDLIVANRGKSEVLGVGTVTDGYSYSPHLEKYQHTVAVEWDITFAQQFDSPRHAWQPTLAKVPATLWQHIREGRRATLSGPTVEMPPEGELPGSVGKVWDLLTRKGQVVLQGPPGTGKTRLALSVALAMAGHADLIDAAPERRAAALAELSRVPAGSGAARLTTVTFHPSYGYEDFVEGFKPRAAADGAGLNLTMTDGLFRRVCAAAEASPNETFLIVVDEINRGDLPRILGELITLLELDKRGSLSVTLPTSGRQQTVPSNIRIIGTMNSADRSVGHIDAAIRRRFAFVDVPPDLDALDGEVEGLGLAEFLEGLNSKLDASFGPDHLLGQAYLLAEDRPFGTAEQLYHSFHHEIVPLVADYCLGQPNLLRSVLGSLVDGKTGRVIQSNPRDLPGLLADEFVVSETRANGDGG